MTPPSDEIAEWIPNARPFRSRKVLASKDERKQAGADIALDETELAGFDLDGFITRRIDQHG